MTVNMPLVAAILIALLNVATVIIQVRVYTQLKQTAQKWLSDGQ